MQSKYGFADGEDIPPDALVARKLYCVFVNRLAELWGSRIRVIEYDRPGVHNPVLVEFLTDRELATRLTATYDGKEMLTQPSHIACWPDGPMYSAIAQATALNLDFFIADDTTVMVSAFTEYVTLSADPAFEMASKERR
jgi:hypothetical protein